jgi:predicted anti-sigma-YlaC factor YlaD
MSPICSILRESFDDYLGDALPAPQRKMLREHLAACAECLGAAAAKDASFLFARPMPGEVAPDETARILAGVRAGVGHIETERRIAAATRRRFAGVAAAAAAAVVALLVLTRPGGSDVRRQPQAAALPAPVPSPGASISSGLAPAGLPAEAASGSSGATVYDLNPGADRAEPRVVWIVDRGLDI